MFHRTLLSLVLFGVLAPASSALANPSDKQPHASIDIHHQQFAPQLLDTAQTLAEKNRVATEKFQALAKEKKLLKVDMKDLSTAHVNALRLQRAAEQLILLGEPAGIDYAARAAQQSGDFRTLSHLLQVAPEASQVISRLRTSATQASQLAQKQIPKIEKLVERKDWDTAEKEMYEALDQVELYALYLDVDGRVSVYQPWSNVQSKIKQALTESRKEAANKLFAERITATKADLGKLLAEVQAAPTALKKSPQHMLDGEMRTGPELVAHFDTAWQKAQVATVKTLALEWALANNTSPVPTKTWAELRSQYTMFATDMESALPAIIAADAERADATAAPALYQAYLPVIADLVDHAGGKLESECQAALDPLVAKAPALATNVQAYRTVTDDLLRWRQRIAAEQANAQAKQMTDASNAAKKAFERGTDVNGLVDPDSGLEKATLREAAPKLLTACSPKIVGQSVYLSDICALGGNGSAGIARYQKRLYGRVTLPTDAVAAEVSALEAQLMVTEQQPPLSLAATRAVRGARRGDLVQTGGTVAGVFLEAQVTRFATLPDAAAMLLPLGKLPDDHAADNQLAQMILRVDLQPTWVQQRYLFVKLP